MRNMPCYKLTICPYTPEFNPIERMFNTLKWNSSDGVERYQLLELTEFISWHMNQIERNTYISYFQLCLTEMIEHVLTFSHYKEFKEDIPEPKDKLIWKINDWRPNKYECKNRRYIITDGSKF